MEIGNCNEDMLESSLFDRIGAALQGRFFCGSSASLTFYIEQFSPL